MFHRRTGVILPMLAAAALALAGCSSSTQSAESSGASASVRVVTSTNVYGAIVKAIGGERVSVTAILSDPSADPHSFEAAPKQQALVDQAQLVVANGGGYDDFAATMAKAAASHPTLLSAVEVAGLDAHDHGADEGAGHSAEEEDGDAADGHSADDGHEHDHSVNEHVFYDLPAMTKLAGAIADELARIDPSGKDFYTGLATSFKTELAGLQKRAGELKAKHPNTSAIVTEPVAGYLLEAAGIADVTPKGFTQAVEAETDPAAKDVADVSELLTGRKVQLLVLNNQTAGPVIGQVRTTAEQAGIPVVEVSETLPEGVDSYPAWIAGTLEKLEKVVLG